MGRYTIQITNEFKRTFKLCKKRGKEMFLLKQDVDLLEEHGELPLMYKPHKLSNKKGNGTWECHIQPDWLLVWQQDDHVLTILLLSTGSHSDLFK